MANYTREEQFKMIRDSYEGWKNFKNIDNQDEEVCLEAVKINGHAIEYIKNPTDEMKLEAVRSQGRAIKYIDNPTDEMKLEAVKQNGGAIEYIDDPTDEMKLEAVNKNGWAIQYIENPTNEICFFALKHILKGFDGIEFNYENLSIKNAKFIIENPNMAEFFYDDLYDDKKVLSIHIEFFNKLKNYILDFNNENCIICDKSVDIKIMKEIAISDNELMYIKYSNIEKVPDLCNVLSNKVIYSMDLFD